MLPAYDVARASGTQKLGIEQIGMFYRFWRGSVRFKFIAKNGSQRVCSLRTAFADGTSIKGVSFSSDVNPVLDVEMPYYTNNLFMSTSIASSDLAPNVVHTDAMYARYYLKAAGDDFSFHWLCAPPLGFIAPPATNSGNQGLLTYTGTT